MQDRPSSALTEGTDPFYASLIDRSVDAMLVALGTTDIEAVLMIGAPARGEATVVSTPSGPYSLSDIDLVCLSAPGADVPALKRRLARWVSTANEELGDSCAGLDASVKSVAQLASLPSLITTFEMARSPIVVWGDRGAAAKLRAPAIEDVPRWDSLVLFHNRIVEQALLSSHFEKPPMPGDEGGEPSSPFVGLRRAAGRLYASGKFMLDSMTALLFLSGNVPPTYSERSDSFARELLAAPGREHLAQTLEPWLHDIETWASFKTTGDLSSLRSLRGVRLGDEAIDRVHNKTAAAGSERETAQPDAAELETMSGRCWESYSTCAAHLWRATLGDVVGVDVTQDEFSGLTALYSRLESPARKGVRALKMLRSPAGRSGLFSTRRILALAPFASPRQLAYMMASLCYVSVGEAPDQDELSTLAGRYCPFRVPGSFAGMTMSGKRTVLVDRLKLFHHAVLRGREIRPAP